MKPRVLAGLSGWNHLSWRGAFYPESLPKRLELAYAALKVPTLEIGGTFYRLHSPRQFAIWSAATPEGFVFSLKAHRAVTHLCRLSGAGLSVARFFGSGPLCLGPKLGAIIWQLPLSLTFDPVRIRNFFELLPKDSAQAERMARHYNCLRPGAAPPPGLPSAIRHAIEVRHKSYACPAFVAQLRHYKMAVVNADTAGKWPRIEDPCADFMVLRLKNGAGTGKSGYFPPGLDYWARRMQLWACGGEPPDALRASPEPAPAAAGRDIYCYFDGDATAHAPFDAMHLNARLGLDDGAKQEPAALRRVGAGWEGLGLLSSGHAGAWNKGPEGCILD